MNRRFFGKILGVSPLTIAAAIKGESHETLETQGFSEDLEMTGITCVQSSFMTAMPSIQWISKHEK